MRPPLAGRLLLALALALPAPAVRASTVAWENAGSHVGERVSIEGEVAAAHVAQNTCVLEFAPDDDAALRVRLLLPVVSSLPPHPERLYAGKRVVVTGTVRRFLGKLEMVVNSPSAIEVMGVAGGPATPPMADVPATDGDSRTTGAGEVAASEPALVATAPPAAAPEAPVAAAPPPPLPRAQPAVTDDERAAAARAAVPVPAAAADAGSDAAPPPATDVEARPTDPAPRPSEPAGESPPAATPSGGDLAPAAAAAARAPARETGPAPSPRTPPPPTTAAAAAGPAETARGWAPLVPTTPAASSEARADAAADAESAGAPLAAAVDGCRRAREHWAAASATLRTRMDTLARCLDGESYRCSATAQALAPALTDLEWAEQRVEAACPR